MSVALFTDLKNRWNFASGTMSEQWRRLVAKIWNYKPHMLFPPPDHEKISFWCDDIHLIVYKNASAIVNMKIQQSELD